MLPPSPEIDARPGSRTLVTGAVVVFVTLFVVWTLSPWVWFIDTTPTGGDMGAHVWSPAYLRDELLPRWRLTGWSPDWYAGFPAFTFYMVIPSLLIVVVNVGLDLGLDTWSFIGVAIAVSELTRRLGWAAGTRLAAVAGACAFGLGVSTWWDGRRFDPTLFGWSPVEPFTYNDTSVDLAIVTIVLPAAVGSLAWHATRRFARWRGVATAAAVTATLLAVPVPYGVAMKLVVVAGIVALPFAAYTAGRLGGLAFPGPALMAVMTLPFLFDRSFNIYGGNLMSTMAGEFAYSLGLALAVLYLGFAARGLHTGRDRGVAAALLALAGLSHLFAAFFALVGTFALYVLRPGKRQTAWLAVAGPLAGLLSAFWVLPFLWNRALLNDMGWGKERRYVAALWSRGGSFGDQDFLVNDPPLQLFVVLAVIGAVVCGLRRVRFGMAMALVGGIFAAAFLLLPEGRLWNVRLLPFYYLAVYLMAAIGVAEIIRWGAELLRGGSRSVEGRGPATLLGSVATAVVTLGVVAAVAFPARSVPFAGTFTRVDDDGTARTVYGFSALGNLSTGQLNLGPGWLRYNFTGYENKPGTDEYTAMVATMDEVGREFGCGRALWEFEGERLGSYGTTMAPMLLPHWTDGCIGSMEGLYFEASATTPYHFLLQSEMSAAPSRAQRDLPYSSLDVDRGVEGMRALGVRYYLAFSESAVAQARANPDLTEIATSGPWVVFLLDDATLVSGLDHLPVVVDGVGAGGDDWLVPTVAAWDAGPGLPLIAADGPDDWPRAGLDELEDDDAFAAALASDDRVAEIRAVAAALPERLPVVDTTPVEVRDVVTTTHSVAFSVDQVGRPVLVRTSYFPNWRVSGAEGPYRVSPNLMVVVPTDTRVELRYGRSGVEVVATVFTLLGIAGLVFVGRRPPTGDGGAPWDFTAPALEAPPADEVFDRIAAAGLDRAGLDEIRVAVGKAQSAGWTQAGVALSLLGLSLLLGLFVDTGADRAVGSLVVFGPAAAGLVVAVFGAAPLLHSAASYRRRVLFPAQLVVPAGDEIAGRAAAPGEVGGEDDHAATEASTSPSP